MPLLRRFPVGFVAAGFQLAAVAFVTPVVLALVQNGFIGSLSTGANVTAEMETQSSVLKGAYLIIGFGVALTENRFLDFTALHIRQISHRDSAFRTNLVIASLLILFCLGIAGFTMLTLQRPPSLLFGLERWYSGGEILPILWPGTMSIGAVCFGATAHACLRALQDNFSNLDRSDQD